MAHFNQHCRDCKNLLGDPCENVNRWIDELFKTKGPNHRRIRHHWNGVWEAFRLFGEIGARAAIVHIVRDCGAVPNERWFDREDANALGIIISPEFLMYAGHNITAEQKFRMAVEKEWVKWEKL